MDQDTELPDLLKGRAINAFISRKQTSHLHVANLLNKNDLHRYLEN